MGLRWIEDGDPAKAEAFAGRRKPKRMNGHDGGPDECAWHGLPAEAGTGRGGGVSKDSDVDWGFAEAGEFEAGVCIGLGVVVAGEGFGVGLFEVFGDGLTADRIVNEDPAPWLREANGGGEHRLPKQILDEGGVNRSGKKVANVAAPTEEVFEIGAEGGGEDWRSQALVRFACGGRICYSQDFRGTHSLESVEKGIRFESGATP